MFWKKIKEKKKDKPILVLAPMSDVTDVAFRRLIAKYGKPDVMWTEFVSAHGLILAPKEGKKKLLKNLEYSKKEKPIVAQIFGSDPQIMTKTARLCVKLGFDGIDINMGCPDRSVEKQKSGAAMIKNPELARQIILAVKKGAGKIPVSVKTRLGYGKDDLDNWLPILLSTNPALITVHARTRKEMSKVPANWDRVKRAVEIRNEMKSDTLIFGNGDVVSIEDAYKKTKDTGCDGVMIGRGIFGKPWFFSGKEPNLKKRLLILVEHSKLFNKHLADRNFSIMKKHFKAYIQGFDGAKELRIRLMETKNAKEVEKVIKDFLKTY